MKDKKKELKRLQKEVEILAAFVGNFRSNWLIIYNYHTQVLQSIYEQMKKDSVSSLNNIYAAYQEEPESSVLKKDLQLLLMNLIPFFEETLEHEQGFMVFVQEIKLQLWKDDPEQEQIDMELEKKYILKFLGDDIGTDVRTIVNNSTTIKSLKYNILQNLKELWEFTEEEIVWVKENIEDRNITNISMFLCDLTFLARLLQIKKMLISMLTEIPEKRFYESKIQKYKKETLDYFESRNYSGLVKMYLEIFSIIIDGLLEEESQSFDPETYIVEAYTYMFGIEFYGMKSVSVGVKKCGLLPKTSMEKSLKEEKTKILERLSIIEELNSKTNNREGLEELINVLIKKKGFFKHKIIAFFYPLLRKLC